MLSSHLFPQPGKEQSLWSPLLTGFPVNANKPSCLGAALQLCFEAPRGEVGALGRFSKSRAGNAKVVISQCPWPGRRARGGGEACAKPNPQLRWFVMLLLTLKPFALALRGKGEAELAVGEICLAPQLHPANLGVYFHLSFPHSWTEDALPALNCQPQ